MREPHLTPADILASEMTAPMDDGIKRNNQPSNTVCALASISVLAFGLFLFFFLHSPVVSTSLISKPPNYPVTEGLFNVVVHNNTNTRVVMNFLSDLGRLSRFYGLFEANEYRVVTCDRAQIGEMTVIYWRKLGEHRETEQAVPLDCVPLDAVEGVLILELQETGGWSALFEKQAH